MKKRAGRILSHQIRAIVAWGLLFLAQSLPAQSPTVEGDWLGTLKVQSMSLRIVFHISLAGDGSLRATMDSPDQGANGLPVDNVTVEGQAIRLTSSAVRGEYAGTLQPGDSTIQGHWTQAGMSIPLPLSRIYKEVIIHRPQDPKPPFPYISEEVTFRNGADDVTLAGTLCIPDGKGPFPAVALVSGSGPQDRDETVFNHKPFRVIADHLARNGIATLRYDDRGVGKSTGNFSRATTEEFARDAEAATSFLRMRKHIDPSRVGLLGHSEGGLVAPMVAARSKDVSFIVMLAGPSITGERIILLQDSLIAVANGVEGDDISEGLRVNRSIFRILASDEDTAMIRAEIARILRGASAELPDSAASAESMQAGIDRQMEQLMSPWFRYFLTYDPYPILANVTCPVLALNGGNDLQVPPRINLEGIADALKEAGNSKSTVKELPGLNHLFQTSRTGSPAEYATIEETFSPTALSVITRWIRKVTTE